MGHVIDVVDWYREILKEDPSSPLFIPLAEILCARGEFAEAEQVARRGHEAHPGNLRGRTVLALALRKLGKAQEAKIHVDAIYSELVRNADLHRMLAEAYEQMGDVERANRLRQAFYALRPDEADIAYVSEQARSARRTETEDAAPTPPAPDELLGTETPAPSAAERLLTAWLENVSAQEPKPPERRHLFTDEDRKALAGLLGRASAPN